MIFIQTQKAKGGKAVRRKGLFLLKAKKKLEIEFLSHCLWTNRKNIKRDATLTGPGPVRLALFKYKNPRCF